MSSSVNEFRDSVKVALEHAVKAYEYGKRDSAMNLMATIVNRAADVEIARIREGVIG